MFHFAFTNSYNGFTFDILEDWLLEILYQYARIFLTFQSKKPAREAVPGKMIIRAINTLFFVIIY